MKSLLRIASLCLVGALALVAAGCENADEGPTLIAETEGIYLDLAELKYQVQISRQLNPSDPEDAEYLTGLPPEDELEAGEVYFGVFLRVNNLTEDQVLPTADHFEIVDTLENVYEPLELDPTVNNWVYQPRELPPGDMIPEEDTAQFNGPTRGALLLFKLTRETLQNRPLEFEIRSPEDPDTVGIVDLDV
jgi:hypothetical protein